MKPLHSSKSHSSLCACSSSSHGAHGMKAQAHTVGIAPIWWYCTKLRSSSSKSSSSSILHDWASLVCGPGCHSSCAYRAWSSSHLHASHASLHCSRRSAAQSASGAVPMGTTISTLPSIGHSLAMTPRSSLSLAVRLAMTLRACGQLILDIAVPPCSFSTYPATIDPLLSETIVGPVGIVVSLGGSVSDIGCVDVPNSSLSGSGVVRLFPIVAEGAVIFIRVASCVDSSCRWLIDTGKVRGKLVLAHLAKWCLILELDGPLCRCYPS
mmetsp:Transcript_12478/g.21606  ORF Transcript_12478/g.21606 Transcript_12478/m.21606 type:complete len:267 (-) Transcript_12478:254-1054(-)